MPPTDSERLPIHYIEFVTSDVPSTCTALEGVLGVAFDEPVPDLGGAKVARMPGVATIGVRPPLADHETPIVRTYFAVDDIEGALAAAEAAGAVVAYPPTRQGKTGTWAIYILGGVQVGLWQGDRADDPTSSSPRRA